MTSSPSLLLHSSFLVLFSKYCCMDPCALGRLETGSQVLSLGGGVTYPFDVVLWDLVVEAVSMDVLYFVFG